MLESSPRFNTIEIPRMKDRKIPELKNEKKYLDIWSDENYNTDFKKALAMLEYYCLYDELNSSNPIYSNLAAIRNLQKIHVKAITKVIDYYCLIKPDSITRTIEFLIYKLNQFIDVNSNALNDNLLTILSIIKIKTNIDLTQYRNCNFINKTNSSIELCTSWLSAFYQNQFELPAPAIIMDKLWQELKNDKTLLENLDKVEKYNALFIITKNINALLSEQDLYQIYKNSLISKRGLISAFLFCKLNSIPELHVIPSEFSKALPNIISAYEGKKLIPAKFILDYFEASDKTSSEVLLDLCLHKKKIDDWEKIEATVKLKLNKALDELFISLINEFPINIEKCELFLAHKLTEPFLIECELNEKKNKIDVLNFAASMFPSEYKLKNYSRYIFNTNQQQVINILKLIKLLLDHDFRFHKHFMNFAVSECYQILISSPNVAAACGEEFMQEFSASEKKASLKSGMFSFFLFCKRQPYATTPPKEIVENICQLRVSL